MPARRPRQTAQRGRPLHASPGLQGPLSYSLRVLHTNEAVKRLTTDKSESLRSGDTNNEYDEAERQGEQGEWAQRR